MLVQGYAMGLTIHAMAGYNEQKIAAGPAHSTAVSSRCNRLLRDIGGTVESLPEDVRAKDLKPRVRKPASEFVFRDEFGTPL
jgi:hypothetical protein